MLSTKVKKQTTVLIISMVFITSMLGFGIPTPKTSTIVGSPLTSQSIYYDRFMELFDDIQTGGYLSQEGVPYHTVETLLVEAPDYGHLTTSEAFSFLTWLYAMYGYFTNDWSYYRNAWDITEQYIIPDQSSDQPGTSTYDPNSPAQYAPEEDLPSDYPNQGDANAPNGIDPIYDSLRNAYGTSSIYQMHWLLDVDNWYGYGNHGDGTSRCSYINTYQRGPQESVWETVPHPSWEDYSWGTSNGGFLPLFGDFGDPAQQWRYTSASDADARQVQASYWALKWAEENGASSQISTQTSNAAKMGDYLRYTMIDKYFRPIATDSTMAGSGDNSMHYLLSWYASWGGDLGGAWSWRIGCSHNMQGYQNVMAAYALTNENAMRPQASGAVQDWQTSLNRQMELFEYLQSAEGAIAGGVTNSWNGRYDPYPSGASTFYDMAYDWQPVYHDPPSNNWFGYQAWSMERMMEYYYETGDSRAEAICDKWADWVIDNTLLNSDGTFQVPTTLTWSGQPDTWTGSPTGNPNLHVSVDYGQHGGVDIGVVACAAKALIYHAAGHERWDDSVYEPSRSTAQELLDRMWTLYRDDIGVAAPEVRGDYSRFNDEVYIPSDYNGVNAQGATLENGMTFIDMRPRYLDDPDWARVSAAINSGQDPEMLYHRFWAQADVAMANGVYDMFFGEEEPGTVPSVNSPSNVNYQVGDTGNSITWTATDDNPTTYTITRGGTQVASGSWTSGSPITVSVDGLSVGSYTYTITVSDGDSQTASDSVTVSVSDIGPTEGGEVWFSTVSSQSVGSVFTTDIYVDTGTQNLAAYGFQIDWDPNIITVQGGNSGVDEGADGFLAAANVDNNAGTMMVTGFEATGVGPNDQLHLLTITWEAVAEGETVLDLSIDQLIDSDLSTVGTPTAIDGNVVVASHLNGDVNHDDSVNIIDALLIAQYYVGQDPQPFYTDVADVNHDGSINIVDALLVAQYYVGAIPELP